MTIRKVGVVGGGLMGSGIAQVVSQAGFSTVICEVSQELVAKSRQVIEKNLTRVVEKGFLTNALKAETLSRLVGSTAVEDLADCDVVIEAIVEQLPAKRDLFRALDAVCKPTSIFASNTSSLTITELACTTKRPDRFVGIHFFNPAPLMKLVEVVRTIATAPQVYEEIFSFCKQLGKSPVQTNDRAGFIVNRLLVPYLLDAIRALDQGIGSIEDIDSSMKLGCGYPMGPFALLDFIGLDTTYYIANVMFDEFREQRFAPPPLLKRMVLAGRTGPKAGCGFYDYADKSQPKSA
jgi:3-hydroxybutyryl-CoA dehydrogenase